MMIFASTILLAWILEKICILKIRQKLHGLIDGWNTIDVDGNVDNDYCCVAEQSVFKCSGNYLILVEDRQGLIH